MTHFVNAYECHCAQMCHIESIVDTFFCLFVSLLSHFWLIHFFHLRLLYQPYLGLCQAPCVQSHQRQPMSAVAITACEVQVSAADSQTVPTVVTGVSKPLCCRLTLTFTLTSENLSLCTTLLLLLLLVLIQLCSPRCWHRKLQVHFVPKKCQFFIRPHDDYPLRERIWASRCPNVPHRKHRWYWLLRSSWWLNY